MNSKIPTISQTQEILRRKKRTFSDRLKSNIPQKVMAFFCAIGLFILVMSDRNMTMTFDEIPVMIQVPDGYAIVGTPTASQVNVKVYGRASKLRQLSRDDLGSLSIMPSAHKGNNQVTLRAEMLSMPEGVKVEKFQPEFIGLDLEPIAYRTVPISTDHAFTGELPPGYQMGEVNLDPVEIEITGAQSLVDETTQLYLEPIDLTGKAAPFTVTRWAILNRAGLKATTSTRVEVTVNVVSQAKTFHIRGVPIQVVNLTKTYELVPSTVDLTIVGDEDSLSKVDPAHLFITIDASQDETQDAHARRIEDPREIIVSNLPAGVGVDESKLPKILLKVSDNKRPETTRESGPKAVFRGDTQTTQPASP